MICGLFVVCLSCLVDFGLFDCLFCLSGVLCLVWLVFVLFDSC